MGDSDLKGKASILLSLLAFISLCTCVILPQGHACCTITEKLQTQPSSYEACHTLQTSCCKSTPTAALWATPEKNFSFTEPAFKRSATASLTLQAEAPPWSLSIAQAFIPDKQTTRYRDFCVLLN